MSVFKCTGTKIFLLMVEGLKWIFWCGTGTCSELWPNNIHSSIALFLFWVIRNRLNKKSWKREKPKTFAPLKGPKSDKISLSWCLQKVFPSSPLWLLLSSHLFKDQNSPLFCRKLLIQPKLSIPLSLSLSLYIYRYLNIYIYIILFEQVLNIVGWLKTATSLFVSPGFESLFWHFYIHPVNENGASLYPSLWPFVLCSQFKEIWLFAFATHLLFTVQFQRFIFTIHGEALVAEVPKGPVGLQQ